MSLRFISPKRICVRFPTLFLAQSSLCSRRCVIPIVRAQDVSNNMNKYDFKTKKKNERPERIPRGRFKGRVAAGDRKLLGGRSEVAEFITRRSSKSVYERSGSRFFRPASLGTALCQLLRSAHCLEISSTYNFHNNMKPVSCKLPKNHPL